MTIRRSLKIAHFALGLYAFASCAAVAQREARASRCVEIKSAPVIYLALGDSTGVGVGAERGGYAARLFARVEQTHPHSRLFNRSAIAATTGDVLRTQLDGLPEIRPDLITLCAGANDLINGVKAEEFARNYRGIITRLKTQTTARIVLMNIPDLSLAPAVPAYMRGEARRHITIFNQHIAETAVDEGLPLVDLFASSESFASHAEFFSGDGIHPSDAGYEAWAELLLPHVNAALDCTEGQRR
jgi:lysophospholipase L1-like esterase